jgi:hypothetical protein
VSQLYALAQLVFRTIPLEVRRRIKQEGYPGQGSPVRSIRTQPPPRPGGARKQARSQPGHDSMTEEHTLRCATRLELLSWKSPPMKGMLRHVDAEGLRRRWLLTSISLESRLLDHSYANDVETGIFKVSIQGNPVRMMTADGVRIVDSYNFLSVIRDQDNRSPLGKTLLHAVSVTIRRSFGAARGTRYVSVDSLTAARRNQQEGK